MSFVASDGFKEVDLVEEYTNHQVPERALLVQIINVLSRYDTVLVGTAVDIDHLIKRKIGMMARIQTLKGITY